MFKIILNCVQTGLELKAALASTLSKLRYASVINITAAVEYDFADSFFDGSCSDDLTDLGILYPTPAYCGEKIYMYLARDMKKSEQHLDTGELLFTEEISLERATEMVMRGEIRDAKTQVMVLKLARMLGV